MIQVKLISLFLLFISFCQVWTYESFNDFPLSIEDGNYIIHATLTDLNSDKKYFIKEFIHASTNQRGKISISSDSSGQIDVHYGSSSKNNRLVVKDFDCDLFSYFLRWDKKISGVTDSLLNHILLVGPSLIYRLKASKSLFWQIGKDETIRGTTMHSSYAIIGSGYLKVTYYYKDSFDFGISQPSRILFSGNDPSDANSYVKQNLVLDIYLQTRTSEELDKIVLPRQGIGCPVYFATNKDLNAIYFDIARDSVHFISLETTNGPSQLSTKNEIYADEENQLLNLKTTSHGITTEAIYDYYLGLIYVRKSDGGCLVSPMGVNAPGVKPAYSYKPFRIDALLDMTYNFRYLGETWFEDRPGFKVDVWESIVTNSTIRSGRYDKIVTTIYTINSANGDTSSGMIPVGEMIHAYNRDTKGSYALIETTQKVYYDFGQQIPDEIYESKFRIGDCYPNPSDRKTFAITFDCKEEDCDDAVAKYYYTFRQEIRTSIQSTHVVSASRIGDIDVNMDSNQIVAYVTFFNFPDLKDALKSSYLYLSSDVFKGSSKYLVGSDTDCLKRSINMDSSFEALAYCGGEGSCYRINKLENLVEDRQKGTGCIVYYTPLKNLYRYSREVPLDEMQNEMKGRELSFSVNQKLFKYKVSRVEELKESEKAARQLYQIENYSSKLVEDGSGTIMATSVNNLADCYRACANTDDNDCETFSYCENSGKAECLLSTSIYANLTDERIYDSNCRIYRKNRLQDYIKIQNREFIHPTSVATDYWTDDCADLCSRSDDCFSFQTCDGRCNFGGYYTDSSTKKSSNCHIYMPKLAHRYRSTGKAIITETYYSEVNLDLDRCAALCYDLDAGDGGCASFNYCPKSTASSSCQLSKYSVRDPASQTITSNVCANYESFSDQTNNVDKQRQNVNTAQTLTTGTGGSAAFGIIILFMTIGLLAGLVGFYVFDKSISIIVRRTPSRNDTFQWSRQIDEEEPSNI